MDINVKGICNLAAMTRLVSRLIFLPQANISRFFFRQQSCLSYAGFVRRSFLSTDFVFVTIFRQQIFIVRRSPFSCQQILSANFCRLQICLSSENVFADFMEMMLKPAYAVSSQPASCRKCFCLWPARISLLSRFHLFCRTFLAQQLDRLLKTSKLRLMKGT